LIVDCVSALKCKIKIIRLLINVELFDELLAYFTPFGIFIVLIYEKIGVEPFLFAPFELFIIECEFGRIDNEKVIVCGKKLYL